jgi:hypothetical protein
LACVFLVLLPFLIGWPAPHPYFTLSLTCAKQRCQHILRVVHGQRIYFQNIPRAKLLIYSPCISTAFLFLKFIQAQVNIRPH